MSTRDKLEAALSEVRALDKREEELLSQLAGVRASRANLDAMIAGQIKYIEGGDYTPERYREMLGGLEAELSKCITRHILSGVE